MEDVFPDEESKRVFVNMWLYENPHAWTCIQGASFAESMAFKDFLVAHIYDGRDRHGGYVDDWIVETWEIWDSVFTGEPLPFTLHSKEDKEYAVKVQDFIQNWIQTDYFGLNPREENVGIKLLQRAWDNRDE